MPNSDDLTPAPRDGALFRIKAEVLSADDIRRALTRIAHEIIERNQGLDGVVLLGLQKGGVWIARLLGETIARIEPDHAVPVGSLDASFHRDDIGLRPMVAGSVSDIPVPLAGARVVLVDDVLYTGRTVRAVLNELYDYGRPARVRLAVLVDRGGRELPVQADFAAARVALPAAQSLALARTEGGKFHFQIKEA